MGKRSAILLTLLAAAGVWAILFFPRAGVLWRPPSDVTAEPAASGWPADKAWAWKCALPANLGKRDGIGLTIRVRSFSLSAGPRGIGSPAQAMPAASAERHFGTGTFVGPAPRPAEAHVVVQLLNLDDIGAASAKPGQPLRVLARLTTGGSTGYLFGDDIYLPTGHFAGSSPGGTGRWVNNELYLMTFYVEDDHTQWQYDVLLERTLVGPVVRRAIAGPTG